MYNKKAPISRGFRCFSVNPADQMSNKELEELKLLSALKAMIGK